MKEQPKTLQQVIRYYSDPETCIQTVAASRWPKGVTCPACEGKDHYYLKTRRIWKCKECDRQFSVKLGTIFEDSPIALDKWLTAMWLLASCKNGISSYEVGRAIGVTQRSAWFMMHRIRTAVQESSFVKLPNSGAPVEVDETFIGGKARNMHLDKRERRITGTGGNDKTIVFGALERGGKVHTIIVKDRKKAGLQACVKEHVKAGAVLYSDALASYDGLAQEYAHKVIDHAEKYVDGQIHTQGLDNFWSLLKRGLNGTYVSVEPFHLFRYLDEQMFRYNYRGNREHKITDADRFNMVLSQVAGKRLTYQQVTGKVGETSF
ncbi:MAG TPA: IS1595 family transposase [Terriglobales bacterium]|jgi:transposase-like protein